MDKDSIAKATPLVERKLASQRASNKTAIAKSVLASSDKQSNITPEWLSKEVRSEFSVDLDDGTTEINANSILASLESEGVLNQEENGSYEIESELEVGSFSQLIDPVWEEFSSYVDGRNPDIDLHFINDSFEDAFYAFFERYLGFLTSSSVELSEYEMDQFYTHDIESMVENTAQNHPLRDEELFKSELLTYLDQPSDELLDLVNNFYMTAVNVDLLSRETQLNFEEIPGDGKKLLLDTNVLVALLCDTDNSNSLAASVCERSKEIGFELVYIEDTKNELNRLIHGSRQEMDGFRSGDKEFDAVRSQFVHDYLKRDDISWDEYVAEISDWERLLELNWGISKFDDDIETESEVYEFTYDTFKQLERADNSNRSRESNENKINHDANLVSVTARLREKSSRSVELGPYLLTLHNKLTTVSEIGKEQYWDDRVALQLRTWLNYLATFTPSDMTDADSKGIATAIIESSRSSSADISSIQEYARLVAPKAGLDSREEDILTDYFINHPLSREMQKALENNRGDQAEQLAKEMLEDEDRLERFEKLESQSEKVDELRDSLSSVRERWEKEREKREQLESILESQNKIEINMSANASTDVSVENNIEDINKEINEFIELLDTRLPNGYAESDLPEPPSSDPSLEETEEWLRDLKISIASSGTVATLEPYAGELLDSVSSMM